MTRQEGAIMSKRVADYIVDRVAERVVEEIIKKLRGNM